MMDVAERSKPDEQRSMTRARLLRLGALAALTAGAAPSRAFAADSPTAVGRGSDTPAYLRFATYPPLVGDSFGVEGAGSAPTQLVLTQATQLPGVGEAFSLLFTAAGARLEQATYRVQHPALRKFEFLLVPIGSGADGQGRQYEAIVNRLP